jgi:hypothetical protein
VSSPIADGDRLWHLADAVCTGSASEEELRELDGRVLADEYSGRLYISYCQLHAALGSELRGQRAGTRTRRIIQGETLALDASASACSFPHVVVNGTFGAALTGWPLAYLLATVILGVGLLLGSLTPVSGPQQIADKSSPPVRVAAESPPEYVGRITGVVDCRFAEGSDVPSTEPRVPSPQTPVALGDKFALISGLLEITYNTGAKVILQGPVSYEVESPAGGYLSVGKLTARVDVAKPQAANQRAEISNPQSPIPNPSLSTIHSPLFSVRTPTTSVTDLGTEFGVNVGHDGRTEVHVLQGVVEARLAGVSGAATSRRLTEGSAVEILPAAARITTVAFAPQAFTRRLQLATDAPAEAAYIKAVLADRPMAYWPLNEPVGARRFQDHSGNGFHGYAMKKVQAGQSGPLPDGRAILLRGDGYIDIGRHNEFALVRDFTVEAWVAIDRMEWAGRVISAASDLQGQPPFLLGWALSAQHSGRQHEVAPLLVRFSLYNDRVLDFLPPGKAAPDRSWAHLAIALDHSSMAHLYVNGEHQQTIQGKVLHKPESMWVSIGAEPGFSDLQPWRGRIAHVAVYPHVLSAQQIRRHYESGEDTSGSHQ